MKVLSIDAWRYDGGWTWNEWHHIGDIASIPEGNRAILRMLRDEGYLSNASCGRVAVEDDGYNVVVLNKSTRMPLLAIEYGETDS